MNETLDIITIGEGLIELSTSTSLKNGGCFDKYYGGDTLVSAISALRSGSSVGYITKVANDSFGEFLLDAWQAEGLDSSQVKLTKGQNGIYFVGNNHDNKENPREYRYYRQKTAASTLSVNDINFEYIKKAKLVYVTGFVQNLSLSVREAVTEIFKFAKENDILTAYDPNCQNCNTDNAEMLENFNLLSDYIDIMFIETKDSELLFETKSTDMLITKLSDLAIKMVVVKDKENGISIYDNNDTINVPALDFEMIDATGVSNAFNGAFLSRYLDGLSTQNAAKYACALCVLQVQNIGAVKSIPYKDKVEEYCGKIYE